MTGCTVAKLWSADVVQLNHDFEPWSYVLDADWSDLIEISDIVLTQERPPVANVFIWLFAMFFLVLILWLSHHHGGEIWGWPEPPDSTVTHSLLDAIGLHKMHFIPNCHQYGQRWQASRCVGRCNASWTDDQSLIRRQRRFRVKPSLTRDLIWTALVQQKLLLNRGQGQILTWFKLDRRWWNAHLPCMLFDAVHILRWIGDVYTWTKREREHAQESHWKHWSIAAWTNESLGRMCWRNTYMPTSGRQDTGSGKKRGMPQTLNERHMPQSLSKFCTKWFTKTWLAWSPGLALAASWTIHYCEFTYIIVYTDGSRWSPFSPRHFEMFFNFQSILGLSCLLCGWVMPLKWKI